MLLKISDITPQKLREGQFQEELPEFFALKQVVENNAWHNNDTVFNHVLTVWEKLKDIIERAGPKVKVYLAEMVDSYTRKDLLFAGTLFHDIAKIPDVAETQSDGTILFPGHEIIGAEKVKVILERFDLSDREKSIVVKIIENHGVLHSIIYQSNQLLNGDFDIFSLKFSDIFVELILLTVADTAGSQLEQNDPDEFEFRMRFYTSLIDNF